MDFIIIDNYGDTNYYELIPALNEDHLWLPVIAKPVINKDNFAKVNRRVYADNI